MAKLDNNLFDLICCTKQTKVGKQSINVVLALAWSNTCITIGIPPLESLSGDDLVWLSDREACSYRQHMARMPIPSVVRENTVYVEIFVVKIFHVSKIHCIKFLWRSIPMKI